MQDQLDLVAVVTRLNLEETHQQTLAELVTMELAQLQEQQEILVLELSQDLLD